VYRQFLFASALFLFPIFCVQAQLTDEVADGQLKIEGENPNLLVAGQASAWQLSFWNHKTGEKFEGFMPMHKKYMHMVVVRDDLSQFAHIHPYLNEGSMTFQIEVN